MERYDMDELYEFIRQAILATPTSVSTRGMMLAGLDALVAMVWAARDNEKAMAKALAPFRKETDR